MEANLILQDSDFDILSLSKEKINEIAQLFVNKFDNSSNDPLKHLAYISKAKSMLEIIEKGLAQKSIDELHIYGGKHQAFGVDFQIAEVGTKYDYSENEAWVKIQNQINDLETKRKEIETFIKGLKSSFTEVNEETGEIIKWYPASKTSTTSIKKTIK